MRPSTKAEIQAAVEKLKREGLITVRPPDARALSTIQKVIYEQKRKERKGVAA